MTDGDADWEPFRTRYENRRMMLLGSQGTSMEFVPWTVLRSSVASRKTIAPDTNMYTTSNRRTSGRRSGADHTNIRTESILQTASATMWYCTVCGAENKGLVRDGDVVRCGKCGRTSVIRDATENELLRILTEKADRIFGGT